MRNGLSAYQDWSVGNPAGRGSHGLEIKFFLDLRFFGYFSTIYCSSETRISLELILANLWDVPCCPRGGAQHNWARQSDSFCHWILDKKKIL